MYISQKSVDEHFSIDEINSDDDESSDINSPPVELLNQEGLQETAMVAFLKEEDILKKLDKIISMRGKRGTNYDNQLDCFY